RASTKGAKRNWSEYARPSQLNIPMVWSATPASRSRTESVANTSRYGSPVPNASASISATRRSARSAHFNLRFSATTYQPFAERLAKLNRLKCPQTGARHGKSRQDRRRVEEAAHGRAVQRDPEARHRARFHGKVARDQGRGHVHVHLLRAAALRLGDEVRFRHRMA